MGPLARYEHELNTGKLNADEEQRSVIVLLDTIASNLSKRKAWKPQSTGLLSRLFGSNYQNIAAVEGLYLWGGVGRGKTYLCDLFFEELAFEDKTRLHFHRFMKRIHDDLRELGQVENPLPLVADKWAAKTRLLMLDEIHVWRNVSDYLKFASG